jgi:hypothetical protein
MPSILIDPAYEAEMLRFYVARVQRLLAQSKAAGLLSVPTTVLETALRATDDKTFESQLATEQVEQLWFESQVQAD